MAVVSKHITIAIISMIVMMALMNINVQVFYLILSSTPIPLLSFPTSRQLAYFNHNYTVEVKRNVLCLVLKTDNKNWKWKIDRMKIDSLILNCIYLLKLIRFWTLLTICLELFTYISLSWHTHNLVKSF